MKAVILCAGKSTRTYPLTAEKPKPLLPVLNVPIILRNLQQLQGIAKEAVLVVGFGSGKIKSLVGRKQGSLSISYAEQKQQKGTGHALLQLRNKLKEKFLVLNGDDLYSHADLQQLLQHPAAVLGREVREPSQYGVLERKGAFLAKIAEKPLQPKSKLANTGAYALPPAVFDYSSSMRKSPRGELELTDLVTAYARKNKVRIISARLWHPITFPWSLLEAHEALLHNIESDIKGVVERFVTIKGDVIVGKGTVIKSGTYVEGPVVIGENCSIGPNAYLRASTVIGNNCKIGNAVEIKNSVVMNGTNIGHLSYVGDSVIGEHVNLGAGTITANLRHDEKVIATPVKGKMLSSGRHKLGAIIADNVHTGINTSIYPGRKLWPHQTTLPGQVVKKDIK